MGTGYSGMMKKFETTEVMVALTATELYTSEMVHCIFCKFYLHFKKGTQSRATSQHDGRTVSLPMGLLHHLDQ